MVKQYEDIVVEPAPEVTWYKVGYRYALKGDGYYLIYLPKESPIPDRSNETALIVADETKEYGREIYILDGDFRLEYSEIFHQGPQYCIAFYKAHKAQFASKYTERP